MESSSIEDDFVVLLLLKKKKKKGNIGSINPKYREEGEFPFLLRSSGIITGDSKFTSGRQWLSLMLAILEPHIKNKTTNFCELSVQGSIYSALCCEMKWMNLTIAILDFGVRLYGGSELSKHLSKCLPRMRKTQKIEPDLNYFITDKNFEGSV